MEFLLGGVVASLLATMLSAALTKGWRWVWRFPGRYPDVRGEWLATANRAGEPDEENIYIQRQLRSRFRGKIAARNKDRSIFYMDVRGQFYDETTFTYLHFQPTKAGPRHFGSGVLRVENDHRTASGKALFIGTHGDIELPEPTTLSIEMKKVADGHKLPT